VDKYFLFFRNGALGDTLVLVPALVSIRRKFRNAKIALAGNTEVAQFLKALNVIDEYLPASLLLFLSIKNKNKLIRLFSKFSKVFLYTGQFEDITRGMKEVHTFPPLPKNEKNVYSYILSTVKSCEVDIGDDIMPLNVLPEGLSCLLRRNENIDILLHPRYDERSWGIDNFLSLLKAFLQAGCSSAKIIFGPSEREIYNVLKERYKNSILYSGDLFSAASYVLSARCIISDDSGFAHLSANLGAETYIIFGPTSHTLWAPPMKNVKVIRSTNITCAPCGDNYKACAEKICLTSITVEEIFNTILFFYVTCVA